MEKWTRKFETGKKELNFKAFTMFVLEVAKIGEKVVVNTKAAAEVFQQRRNEAMGLFASGHPDASANGGKVYVVVFKFVSNV
jgi:hypothetical protein